ncbi:hypothetical protein K437DRAFT_263337 [Tilletiaria anomala UBC 951]|uniref:Reverse transcriptase Ty1/copia-type domain-containing protein n=1 Tax=Tilletiaria anomala (strain ATCC 24038 / CBS 436.72 / UBC 951) TaxID=1037660 RepID=A0A066VQW9_TILAU|nr:uncharacterized protein K437DRAFT_263337 [Tilletiaria anomala UBC 951]KDN44147.1 hypothetical protein K437DRAFT_263337 [Tilletiaria anomala UBC 951]
MYALVFGLTTLRAGITLAGMNNQHLHQPDLEIAHLYSECEEKVYLDPFTGVQFSACMFSRKRKTIYSGYFNSSIVRPAVQVVPQQGPQAASGVPRPTDLTQHSCRQYRINQAAYARTMLQRFDIAGSKAIATPASNAQEDVNASKASKSKRFNDAVIGSLLYLAIPTQPNLAD